MRVLLVGALRAETLPLLAWLERPSPRGRRLVVGRRGALDLGVLQCGVGPERAEARTRAALAQWPAEVVISLGTCGALRDGLSVGALVSADSVALEGGAPRPVAPLAEGLRAPLLTVRTPVFEPARRAALAGAAAACEMEAAGVLAAAGGARFHALKVVSDLAGGDDDAGPAPWKLDLVRFQALALRLSQARLAPALARALDTLQRDG